MSATAADTIVTHAADVIAQTEITEEMAQSKRACEDGVAEPTREYVEALPLREQVAIAEAYDWKADDDISITSAVAAVPAWGAEVSENSLQSGIIDAASHATKKTVSEMLVEGGEEVR